MPGIEVNLTATPTQASAAPKGPAGVPGWELATVCRPGAKLPSNSGQTCYVTSSTPQFTATFTARIIKVGPVAAGTAGALQLAQFTNYSFGITDSAPFYATTLRTSAANVVTTCSTAVLPSSTIVLPTVSTQSFQGVGTTSGETPFTIHVNCTPAPQGSPALAITLDTANPQAGAAGVIAPTTGTGRAKSVGVQLLQGNGGTPVTFGATIPEGPVPPSGSLPMPFFARYYQTAGGVTAGTVTATATYTLIYP